MYIYGYNNICTRSDNLQYPSIQFYNTRKISGADYGGTAGSFHLISSGTLDVVLNYLKTYVKNVNIYVDGVC